MSLEDKIINPMVPAQLPDQSDPLPKAGKKRRKSGAAAAKAKKSDIDDEVGGDSTAVLTLGPTDAPRRPPKKMLFESASDGATLSFAGPAIHRETPKPAPVAAPAAKVSRPVSAEPVSAPVAAKETPSVEAKSVAAVAVTPAPVVVAAAPVAAKAETKATREPVAEMPAAPILEAPVAAKPVVSEAKPEPKEEAAIAAMKSPVFQVAALAAREPEPQPQDENQAELPLGIDTAADQETPAAAEAAAPVVDEANDESFHESLTLSFDETLAEGLAERSAAQDDEIQAETTAAAEPETVAAPTPEPAPTPIAPVEPQVEIEQAPAPIVVAPPAPVAEIPRAEPTPDIEAPARTLSRSEMMIARAARTAARTPVRPVPTAAETLAAARTAQQQLRSADLPKNPGDIYGYWTRVKNGRRFPSRADFDAEQVAENWPNSMLLTCGSGIGAGSHGNFSSVLRLGANRRSRPGEDLNFTSMITEWILATGGEAARAGTPVQDTEVFPTPDGTHAYKIVALPLSENQTRVDHVLCHLSRS